MLVEINFAIPHLGHILLRKYCRVSGLGKAANCRQSGISLKSLSS